LNLSFYIQPVKIDTTNADLYLDINARSLSYVIIDSNICLALAIYRFEPGSTDETIAQNIHQVIAEQPVLQQRFNKVHVIFGYNPFVLVPHQFMNGTDHHAMLELVYGESNERAIRTDFMYRHAIHIVYGIPKIIDNTVRRYFDLAQCTHLFSMLPDIVAQEGVHLHCIFNTGQVKVVLMKEGKLQLMQNYSYNTPEDAAFYLLHICKNFEVNVNTCKIHLSGMIDESSSLYAELYKYFLQIQLEPLPEQFQYPEEINQYPAHYFSHLFSIAACV